MHAASNQRYRRHTKKKQNENVCWNGINRVNWLSDFHFVDVVFSSIFNSHRFLIELTWIQSQWKCITHSDMHQKCATKKVSIKMQRTAKCMAVGKKGVETEQNKQINACHVDTFYFWSCAVSPAAMQFAKEKKQFFCCCLENAELPSAKVHLFALEGHTWNGHFARLSPAWRTHDHVYWNARKWNIRNTKLKMTKHLSGVGVVASVLLFTAELAHISINLVKMKIEQPSWLTLSKFGYFNTFIFVLFYISYMCKFVCVGLCSVCMDQHETDATCHVINARMAYSTLDLSTRQPKCLFIAFE